MQITSRLGGNITRVLPYCTQLGTILILIQIVVYWALTYFLTDNLFLCRKHETHRGHIKNVISRKRYDVMSIPS